MDGLRHSLSHDHSLLPSAFEAEIYNIQICKLWEGQRELGEAQSYGNCRTDLVQAFRVRDIVAKPQRSVVEDRSQKIKSLLSSHHLTCTT